MAIDPERLRRQVTAVASQLTEVSQLRRDIELLFEEYQVRRRTAGRTVSSVPRPVLRSLAKALLERMTDDELTATELVNSLWSMHSAEARELATRILEHQTAGFVAAVVEQLAAKRLPTEQLEQLAGRGLAGWRRADGEGFQAQVARWLDNQHQALSLFALTAAVRDGSQADLPAVFTQIGGLTAEIRGRNKQALAALITALAFEAPVETVHYLTSEIANGGSATRTLVRSMMPQFPSDMRQLLESQGGIMRRLSRRVKRSKNENHAG